MRTGDEEGARRRRSGARRARRMARRTFLTFLASDESGEGVGSLILGVKGGVKEKNVNGWRAEQEVIGGQRA
jgi:hypothetical protein